MIAESAAAGIATVFCLVGLTVGYLAGRWLGKPDDPRI